MHRFLAIGLAASLALVLCSQADAWSWPAGGDVLRPFVLGADGYAGGQHRGIDVAGAEGSAVRAPASGVVTFAGSLPTYGEGVTLLTADGYSVTLVHLGAIGVSKGDEVSEGAPVGTMGASGTPEQAVPSVHLGIRRASDEEGYVDPTGLLPPRAAPAPAAEPPPAPAPQPVPTPVAVAQPPSPPAPTASAAAGSPASATAPAVVPGPAPAAAATPAQAPAAAVTAPPPTAASALAETTAPSPIEAPGDAPPASRAGIEIRRADADAPAVRPGHPDTRVETPPQPVPLGPASGPALDASRAVDRSIGTAPRPAAAPTAAASPAIASGQPSTGRARATHAPVTAATALSAGSELRAGPTRQMTDGSALGARARGGAEPRARPAHSRGVARVESPRSRPPSAASTPASLHEQASRPVRDPDVVAGPRVESAAKPSSEPTPGGGDLPKIAAALGLAALLAAAVGRRAARRIGMDGALLRHHADLLRQLDAAHRARVHDRGRGRVRPPSAAART